MNLYVSLLCRKVRVSILNEKGDCLHFLLQQFPSYKATLTKGHSSYQARFQMLRASKILLNFHPFYFHCRRSGLKRGDYFSTTFWLMQSEKNIVFQKYDNDMTPLLIFHITVYLYDIINKTPSTDIILILLSDFRTNRCLRQITEISDRFCWLLYNCAI